MAMHASVRGFRYNNRSTSSYEDDESCYGSSGNNYKQTGIISRYCDSLPAVNTNPKIIGEIINDLHCVFEKTFGQNRSIQRNYECMQSEIEDVKDALDESEDCISELQREIIKLRAELDATQRSFDEEIQRRIALEGLVAQLKAHFIKLEAVCDSDGHEKNQLANCLRDAELKLKELTDAVQYLELEREQLLRNCRGLEAWKDRKSENIAISEGRCGQLEDALRKCCKANDELQMEIRQLKAEAKNFICIEQQLQNERNRVLEELQKERMCWSREKDLFEKTISDLRKAMEELMLQKEEICRKMNEVVSIHHSELDCLARESERYQKFYECEKKEREKLEKALRDCEERKFKQQAMSTDPSTSNQMYNCNVSSERIGSANTRNQDQNKTELDQLKDQNERLKNELKTERETVYRLKFKIDAQQGQLRKARKLLEEMTQEDSKS